MIEIPVGGGVPIYSWAKEIEPGALAQAVNVARMPRVVEKVAIMPDVHQGYGMPIGGVAALEGVICPNMVGVDIGCGMRYVEFDALAPSLEMVKKIMGGIRKIIPVGFEHRKEGEKLLDLSLEHPGRAKGIKWNDAPYQVGTLGGGNHFIELQVTEGGRLALMIHSGSRNIGLTVCNYYMEIAKRTKNGELSCLGIDTEEGKDYINDMGWCVRFAHENRLLIAMKIGAMIVEMLEARIVESLDVKHNYAEIADGVVIHRKGAVSARDGERVIIPGSQGTSSYIGVGKGVEKAWWSCSHGAGRRMGRGEAKRKLNLNEEQKKMFEAGVVHGMRTVKDLDEAPGAYKQIEEVMEQQKELVGVGKKLRPIGVVKG